MFYFDKSKPRIALNCWGRFGKETVLTLELTEVMSELWIKWTEDASDGSRFCRERH
jgi:hypothetical protein